jgi:hypothetical protein
VANSSNEKNDFNREQRGGRERENKPSSDLVENKFAEQVLHHRLRHDQSFPLEGEVVAICVMVCQPLCRFPSQDASEEQNEQQYKMEQASPIQQVKAISIKNRIEINKVELYQNPTGVSDQSKVNKLLTPIAYPRTTL